MALIFKVIKLFTRLQNFLTTHENSIVDWCSKEPISWKFIPPNLPYFGGLWESAVKRVKFHLYRPLKDTTYIKYEGFYTLLVQMKATLNSIPLYPASSDPNDLQPWTSANFLTGRPLTSLPDVDQWTTPTNRQSKFELQATSSSSKFLNKVVQRLLPTLQHRGAKRKPAAGTSSLVNFCSTNRTIFQHIRGF